MAKSCLMNHKTLKATLIDLISKQILVATPRPGHPTVYHLNPIADWTKPSFLANTQPELLPHPKTDPPKTDPLLKRPPPNQGPPKTDGVKNGSPLVKRFTIPTIEEVEAYFKDIFMPPAEAQRFLDYHESKGWKVGNAPMKCWKAASRTWKGNYQRYSQTPQQPPQVPKAQLSEQERLRRMLC